MRTAMIDVIAFMRAMGQRIEDFPVVPDVRTIKMRLDLIAEESAELNATFATRDIEGIADACADLVYVTIGCAIACGIDLGEVWRRVHGANMAKAGGPIREDGKRLKPEGWTAPDIAGALEYQAAMSSLYPVEGT